MLEGLPRLAGFSSSGLSVALDFPLRREGFSSSGLSVALGFALRREDRLGVLPAYGSFSIGKTLIG